MLNRSELKTAAFAAVTVSVFGVSAVVSAEDGEAGLLARAQSMFKPLPETAETADRPVTAARVELGRALFFETRVSSDGKQSCA